MTNLDELSSLKIKENNIEKIFGNKRNLIYLVGFTIIIASLIFIFL